MTSYSSIPRYFPQPHTRPIRPPTPQPVRPPLRPSYQLASTSNQLRRAPPPPLSRNRLNNSPASQSTPQPVNSTNRPPNSVGFPRNRPPPRPIGSTRPVGVSVPPALSSKPQSSSKLLDATSASATVHPSRKAFEEKDPARPNTRLLSLLLCFSFVGNGRSVEHFDDSILN